MRDIPSLTEAERRAHARAVASDAVSRSDIPSAARVDVMRHLGGALDRLAGRPLPPHLLHGGDAFGPATKVALADLLAEPGVVEALRHAATLTKPVPSAKWSRAAEPLLAAAGDAVRAILERFTEHGRPVHEDTDGLLRGLTWMVADDQTELLGRVAVTAAGLRFTPRTAAAAVEALAGRSGDVPVRVLGRLSLTVQRKGLLVRIQRALDRVGAARGWRPGEALELAVDDHELDDHARRVVDLGDGNAAVVEIVEDKVRVSKGAPAEARALAKRVGETLAAERRRVEALLAADREWSTVDWIARYLAHPVTGSIGRRLIWLVSADGKTWTAGTPEWRADRWMLVSRAGVAVDVAMDGGRIRLWHPVRADAEEVVGWRDKVTGSGPRQPFKQAFREVYRPTAAEEEVGEGGSNRFAGHILRYRQANALMRARGWHAGFLGPWDGGGHSDATKSIGAWRVSLGHDLIGEIDPLGNEAQYCATDEVRFDRRDGGSARLADIPATVFSEAMRDVDLFVGVTSIATDPAWAKQTGDRFYEYWEASSFGELAPSAEIRRDVLARILPTLTIAGQCELDERHMRVRGTRRVYKIHLGSGNVLMEPDDAYLHIVAKPDPRARLPHDDPTLAVILSKAAMLAADNKITDAAFVDQLQRASIST